MAEKVLLIIDDDKELMRDLTSRLDNLGHDVLTTSDKAEAVKAINAISLDLMILEVNIPYGLEILKHIKLKRPKTKIIVYSRCDYDTKKTAEDMEVDEFLPKTAEISMLLDAVQHVLK